MASFGVIILLDGIQARDIIFFGKASVFIGFLFGAILTYPTLERSYGMKARRYTKLLLQYQKIGYWLLTRWNPLCALPVALFYIGKAIVWMVKATPEMVVWLERVGGILRSFLVVALKNVHSQKRALVFFDAVAGAMIGYLLDSALVGVFIGALILYPLHRELVAVRLLKVVPS